MSHQEYARVCDERDALRAEVERLKADLFNEREHYDAVKTVFDELAPLYAEAVKMIEESTWHPDHHCEKCVERNNAAREFLAKVKA